MTAMPRVCFTFNCEEIQVDVGAEELLLDTIRDRLSSTSARYSCGIGVCGSCTVLLDNELVSSCLLFTQMVGGRRVETPDAVLMSDTDFAQDVLDSFVESRAYQCSYCIPAIALSVVSALREDPNITVEQMRERLGGNLCRCGSYPQILDAVTRVVQERDGAL